jgi:hypothetical protein
MRDHKNSIHYTWPPGFPVFLQALEKTLRLGGLP